MRILRAGNEGKRTCHVSCSFFAIHPNINTYRHNIIMRNMTKMTDIEEDAWCSHFADQLQGKLIKIGEGMTKAEFRSHVITSAVNILRPGGFQRKKDAASVKEGPAQGDKIDLYAEGHRMSVAVEYDNDKMIKRKSIQKLLFSGADLCVAVSKGPDEERENFACEISCQVQKALEECGTSAPERDLFLLILSQDTMLRLQVFNEDGKTGCEISKVYPFCSYSRACER